MSQESKLVKGIYRLRCSTCAALGVTYACSAMKAVSVDAAYGDHIERVHPGCKADITRQAA